MEDNGDGAYAASVGHVRCEEEDDEGKEVRGRAERLGGERVVAHFGQDFGEEDGEGGEGHVGEEEHGGRDPRDGVAEHGNYFVGLEVGGGLLVAETELGDFLLTLSQVGRRLGRVGDDVPGDGGDDDGREAFDEEEEAP